VRQRESTEHTSLVPQCWRYNVIVELNLEFWDLYVVVKQLSHLMPHTWEYLLLMQDTTAHDDTLWRQCTDKGNETQRQIVGFQRPGRMVCR
jgi:hypothetical protein